MWKIKSGKKSCCIGGNFVILCFYILFWSVKKMICEWMKSKCDMKCWESLVFYTHTPINAAKKYFIKDDEATDVNSWSFLCLNLIFDC